MSLSNHFSELSEVARRIIWFEPPEQALNDPGRFLIYAMTYSTPQDMQTIRRFVPDEDLRNALRQAPPGIIDGRSWAYWHIKLGLEPPPELPTRQL